MDHGGGDFSERREHEKAFVHARMGQDQFTRVDDPVVKEKQVQVQGPVLVAWRLWNRAGAAALCFNPVQPLQQGERSESGADQRRRIDKPVGTAHAERIAAVRRGQTDGPNGSFTLQEVPGCLQEAKRVPQV